VATIPLQTTFLAYHHLRLEGGKPMGRSFDLPNTL